MTIEATHHFYETTKRFDGVIKCFDGTTKCFDGVIKCFDETTKCFEGIKKWSNNPDFHFSEAKSELEIILDKYINAYCFIAGIVHIFTDIKPDTLNLQHNA